MKKMLTPKKLLIALMVMAMMGLGATVYAYRGDYFGERLDDYCYGWQKGGAGGGGNQGYGKGPGRGGFGGRGCFRGWAGGANLSEEQLKELTEARDAFREATLDLRAQIRSKRFELKSEFVKSTPDVEKLKTIQKELSDLEAQFDQKHLEHRLKMKAINPDMPCGKGWRQGRGHGYGRGCGYGRGFRHGHGGGYGRGFGPN